MKVAAPKVVEGGIKLDLFPITTDKQFIRVSEILMEAFQATVVNKVDGPDARIWTLRINGVEVELNHYSSVGNWLFTSDPDGDELLNRVREHLNNLLSD